jgi:general secretion pathway protein G
MLNKQLRNREGQEGFTLIEMMVVVAIIAVLVAVLVPNFMRARAQAQTTSCMMNLKEIATALELYQTDNDQYPTASKVPVNSTDTNLFPYVNQVPIDPAAGAGNYYEYTTTNPASGDATYSIVCPGMHDAATLQKIASGTTNQHIEYDSTGGFTTATAQ